MILVQPDTVVGWHRAGFTLYWNWISGCRVRVGRRSTSKEIRELIFQMVAENPTWGAPRIHGELKMLGFKISERTVLRWMQRTPRQPNRAQLWKAFLANRREAIAAMDFFTVPTLTFGVLYCFFVIATTGPGFFILMPRSTRPAHGRRSSCAKPSPAIALPNT